jgi:hypothetical protein
MIRRTLFIGIALWAATAVAAHAETYTWTDAQGTIHFTEDATKVPAKLRSQVRKLDDNGAPPAETVPAPPAAAEKGMVPADTGAAPATDLPEFTTQEQWQEELQRQEAAMTEVRKQLDVLADRAVKAPSTPENVPLIKEHRALLARYKEMRNRYFQLVAAARKAGFQVDLQQ